MRRIFLLAYISMHLATALSAQTETVKGLNPGDTIPDITLPYFSLDGNQKLGEVSFRGKHTLLDFWNIWCVACIRAFPKIDSFQRAFGEKLQIVPVTQNTIEQVKQLFESNRKIHIPNVPFLNGDSILHTLFPHEYKPMHAWIDDKGVVQYIGSPGYLTISNAAMFLEGEELDFWNHPIQPTLSIEDDFLGSDTYMTSNLISVSAFFKEFLKLTHSQGYKFSKPKDGDKPFHLKMLNVNITSALTFAYSREIYGFEIPPTASLFKDSRMIISDSARIFLFKTEKDSSGEIWRRRTAISYELFMNADDIDGVFRKFRMDLESYSGLKTEIITQKKPCLILKATKPLDGFIAQDSTLPARSGVNSQGYYIQNESLNQTLLWSMISKFERDGIFVVNETNLHKPVSLQLNVKLSKDISKLNKALKKYGLKFEKGEREVKMLRVFFSSEN